MFRPSPARAALPNPTKRSAFRLLPAAIVCACAPQTSVKPEVRAAEPSTVERDGLEAEAPLDLAVQDEEVVSQEELERWTASILKDIETLRESTFPRPVPVAVADKNKMREYMQERMDKMSTPIQSEAEEVCGKLLGLIPGEMDYMAEMTALLESQVGGFYDPDTEGFFLMDRFGGFLARSILAHELTHALDDQLYDIDGTLEKGEGNADAQFAFHAVVEGSGTAVGNAWSIANMGSFDASEISDAGEMGMEGLRTALPYMWKPLLALYMRGAAFLHRSTSVLKGAMSLPVLADIDTAFRSPPTSSEQILHPKKYWDPEHRDEPIGVHLDTTHVPDGWTVHYENTFGEFMWGLVVEPLADRGGVAGQLAVLGAKYTFRASEGWGGDRYVYVGNGEARALVCYTEWDTERDAGEFSTALNRLESHLKSYAEHTATFRGQTGSGVLIRPGVSASGVWYVAWAGTSEEAIEGLLETIAVTVDERRSAATSAD